MNPPLCPVCQQKQRKNSLGVFECTMPHCEANPKYNPDDEVDDGVFDFPWGEDEEDDGDPFDDLLVTL